MKKILLLTVCALSLLTACNKDDDNPEKDSGNYQTPLPEATQVGATMFACYVDGKAYTATGSNVTAFYQYYMGQYGLSLKGSWKNTGNDYIWSIVIESSIETDIVQGNTYDLLKPDLNIFYGKIYFRDISDWVRTTNEQVGKLTITKHDPVKQILSGTFWYDVKRPDGKVVQIRDGRFDVKYAN